jgi:hypothetical protein
MLRQEQHFELLACILCHFAHSVSLFECLSKRKSKQSFLLYNLEGVKVKTHAVWISHPLCDLPPTRKVLEYIINAVANI